MSKNKDLIKSKIKPMIQFIELEAREKVQEIEEKERIECKIEHAKIVEEETKNILADFQREIQNYDLAEQIKYSKAAGQATLEFMEEKARLMKVLSDEMRMGLHAMTKTEEYVPLLDLLVVQGMIYMSEPALLIRYREEDSKFFTSESVSKWEGEYEKASSKKCVLQLDSDHHLLPGPDGTNKASCCGGIFLLTKKQHITCDNTLDERLQKAFSKLLPELKRILLSQ